DNASPGAAVEWARRHACVARAAPGRVALSGSPTGRTSILDGAHSKTMENFGNVTSWLGSHWWLIAVVLFLLLYKWTFRLFGVVIITQSSIGIVNKKFVLFGSNRALPDGRII